MVVLRYNDVEDKNYYQQDNKLIKKNSTGKLTKNNRVRETGS